MGNAWGQMANSRLRLGTNGEQSLTLGDKWRTVAYAWGQMWHIINGQ